MESIDHFIKQQKEMLQMEKNNLGYLETAQTHHNFQHANGNGKVSMVDDSTSVDCDEDDDLEQDRISHMEKDSKDALNSTLSNDSDKGKKHFEEQVSVWIFLISFRCTFVFVQVENYFLMENSHVNIEYAHSLFCHS